MVTDPESIQPGELFDVYCEDFLRLLGQACSRFRVWPGMILQGQHRRDRKTGEARDWLIERMTAEMKSPVYHADGDVTFTPISTTLIAGLLGVDHSAVVVRNKNRKRREAVKATIEAPLPLHRCVSAAIEERRVFPAPYAEYPDFVLSPKEAQ